MNSVFLRDSTAVSDSVMLLFGGSMSTGDIVSFLYSLVLWSMQTNAYIIVVEEDVAIDKLVVTMDQNNGLCSFGRVDT